MMRPQSPFSPLCLRKATRTLQSSQFHHAISMAQLHRKRQFFSSNTEFKLNEAATTAEGSKLTPPIQKRKTTRSHAGKRSLRRVAEEAQRSRESTIRRQGDSADPLSIITAICVAEEFDMGVVIQLLQSHNFPIDPDGTEFLEEQVVHTRGANNGDIFVFPSGTVVAWSLSEDVVANLATRILMPAAINPHVGQIEVEDLEYREDPSRDISSIRGDIITLGTKLASSEKDLSM
jgi:required for meiotic nuclear division protein 1